MALRYVIRALLLVAMQAALVFVPAGRVDAPMAWLVVGSYAAFYLVTSLAMAARDPALVREREHPGPGVQKWDIAWVRIHNLMSYLFFVVGGLGIRFAGPRAVPLSLQVAGLVLFVGGLALAWCAASVNRFFSSMVRIQADRGQYVVSSGPYRYVRHPGYAMEMLVWPGAAIALGSWWALGPAFVIVALYVYRTAREDRMLQEELAGYAEYARKVRYRLVPGVW